LQTYVWLRGHLGDGAAVTAGNGHGQLELTKFHSPAATTAEPNAPANTLGLRRIMFAVDDIEDAVARLRAHGAELVGEVAQYEDSYRLCYVRGPAGIIVALAEQLRLKRDGDRPQSASSWATRSPLISMPLAQVPAPGFTPSEPRRRLDLVEVEQAAKAAGIAVELAPHAGRPGQSAGPGRWRIVRDLVAQGAGFGTRPGGGPRRERPWEQPAQACRGSNSASRRETDRPATADLDRLRLVASLGGRRQLGLTTADRAMDAR
jgi:hypothetical protein